MINWDHNMWRKIKSRKYITTGFIKNIVLLLSLLPFLFLEFSFLKNGIPSGHDIVFHTIYLRLFTDALQQGQFPVRWIEWFRPGLSQPLFLFYQPLYYYLAQIPRFLGFSLADSSKLTILSVWLLSGFFICLFVKNITRNPWSGIIASIVFVFSPYHIVDVFVRAAYPEVVALGFVPGLFWATERLFVTRKKIYVSCVSLCLAAIFIAHLPTLLMFAFPYSCYLVYLFWPVLQKKKLLLQKFVPIVIGLFAGLGIASFFWVPAFLEQSFIQTTSLRSGYYDFHQHFVCFSQLFSTFWGYGPSLSGCVDGMSFQIGLVNLFIFLTGVFVIFYFLLAHRLTKGIACIALWILLTIWAIYMTTSASLPIWTHVPYLSFIQYPWRFLSVVIFSVAIIAGVLFSFLKDNLLSLILYFVFIAIFFGSVYQYLHPQTYYALDYFGQDASLSQFYGSGAFGQKRARQEFGYFPKWTEVLPTGGQRVPASEISDPNGQVVTHIMKKNFIDVSYTISAKDQTVVLLSIHYFPGWRYILDGKEIKVITVTKYGYPQFQISKGEHVLHAFFDNTFVVWIGNMLSISVFVLLFVFLFFPI